MIKIIVILFICFSLFNCTTLSVERFHTIVIDKETEDVLKLSAGILFGLFGNFIYEEVK